MEPIDRIKKLRALADRTTYPAERESCQAKAAELMQKHGITEAHLQPPPVPLRPTIPGTWIGQTNTQPARQAPFNIVDLDRMMRDLQNGFQGVQVQQVWINGQRVV